MRTKKILSLMAVCCILLMQTISAYAYDLSKDTIREKQLIFAAKYEYHEGDFDKSFELYPGITYTSGIEYLANGKAYECPAIYIDEHAKFADSYNIKKGETKFIINGKENAYFNECILYNSRLLIPVEAFREVGCTVTSDVNSYVTTILKDNTVLEILPNLIGMRKNQANGYYVPLEVCARFVDDTLYVPVRAIANEFNLGISWDESTNTVSLNN